MAQPDSNATPKCHILDFAWDSEDSCALTVLINGIRFHIIVDSERVQKSASGGVSHQYYQRLEKAKSALDDDDECGSVGRQMSPIDTCDDAGLHSNLPETGHKTSPSPTSAGVKEDRDSAIDLSADKEDLPTSRNSELELQNWILSAFGEGTEKLAPAKNQTSSQSLHDWYHGRTHFFEMDFDQDQLLPIEVEETEELQERIDTLIPRTPLPKYLRDEKLPWLHARDIQVVSEVDDPGPVHPGRVIVNDNTQFFKPVDPDQPQTVKRELKILEKIESLELGNQIRVPKVLGLVGYEDSTTEIMGYLLTNIVEPQPLTTLLNSDIPESKRLKWADDAKEIVHLLHKHHIVWGDAKADNFMVDKDDNLWIIDFGGSYTEGWVDAEVSETLKGDEMGLDKVVTALVDPDENTFDPEDGEEEDDSDYVPQSHKRKRSAGKSLPRNDARHKRSRAG